MINGRKKKDLRQQKELNSLCKFHRSNTEEILRATASDKELAFSINYTSGKCSHAHIKYQVHLTVNKDSAS